MGELAADCRSAAGVCGAEVRGGAGTLDRLIQGGLLFRQGVLPQASYLFKHALVQDAAYGTRLREPRRALHARIAETLKADSPILPKADLRSWRITAPRLR